MLLDIQIVKELSVLRGAFFISANHPGLRMPRSATSWASCLFAVDGLIIQIKLLIRQQSKLYLVVVFTIKTVIYCFL